MNISKGKWKVGKHPHYIVTDQRTKYFQGDIERGDYEKYELEACGGYVLAESISNSDDAKLMAISPDLLKALNEIIVIAKINNPYVNKDFIILSIANRVLEKLHHQRQILLPEFTETTLKRVTEILFKQNLHLK